MTYQFSNYLNFDEARAARLSIRQAMRQLVHALTLLVLIVSLSANPALAESKHITVRPDDTCHCYTFFRVDANGKPWRVSLKVIEKPKHGTLSITTTNESRTVNGKTQSVPVTRQSYKSKAGYYGEDSFKFVLVVGDPTDRRNGETYSVTVTVR